ncbi:hypothetical protein GCM10009865_04820 [Aeromicrobium ponti]|uniref:UGSC-like domain-containing protein n=2 Tax=Cytobacillus oceanisediminis TaxID=665099 RepID=A0A562K693_9BACI|nr:hypothetical protein IQ19_00390 [Cytobacillus oceanisediminis]
MILTDKVIVLDPTEGPVETENHLAARLSDVSGKRVAFINNGKRNSDVFLSALAEEFRENHHAEVVWFDKKNPSLPFPDALLDQLKSCHAVVAGVGD